MFGSVNQEKLNHLTTEFEGLNSKFEGLNSKFEKLEMQLSSLDENLNIRLTTGKKTNREVFAVELLSKWALNLDKSITSTRKVVDRLGADQCRKIDEMTPFNVSSDYENLLRLSLSKNISSQNKVINLDQDSVAILRWHVTRYLNLLESIMIAWQRGLVEPDIIESEFTFLRSGDGSRFTFSTYRNELFNKNQFEPYPAIKAFENNLILNSQQYQNEKNAYLRKISDDLEALKKQQVSDMQAIKQIVEQELENYRSSNVDDRFNIIRFLLSESAKAAFPILAQKAFETLILFLV